MVCRRVCLADGGIALMCASCVSLVPAVVTAVHTVDFDIADHHLDSEHHSDLLCLAFAQAWTALVGSRLDYAAGIRICGNSGSDYRLAPDQPIGRPTMLGGPVEPTRPSSNSTRLTRKSIN